MVVLVVFFAIFGSYIFISYRDKKGFNLLGDNHRGFKKNKLYKGKSKYDKNGFDFDGYNKEGFNPNGYNKKGFNKFGFDKNGFDNLGYDRFGFNQEGFNHLGFNKFGFNSEGFNALGFNQKGFDSNGFDKDGFDQKGFNRKGFDREDFNKLGFNKLGFNRKGFDINGFDGKGFDASGFNKDGFNIYGINQAGFPWWYVNLYQLQELKDQGKNSSSYKFLKIDSKKFAYPKQSKDKTLTKTSSNILRNPYFILGLNPSSGTKAIQRRVNDILKLITIGQTYRFDFDLLATEIERTEPIVKDAGIKLLNPLERITSIFFWFNLDDEGIKTLFKEENLESVIYSLVEKYITENNLLALKNAIIGSIFLSAKNQVIKPALLMMEYWPIIIGNKTIWNQLLNQFNQNHDFDLNVNPVDEFKDKIVQFIGDVYFQIFVLDPQDSIMFKFYKLFNQYPENYILKVILPKLNEANSLSELIGKFKPDFNSFKSFTSSTRKSINHFIEKAIDFRNFIEKYNLLSRHDVTEIKDKLAQRVRSLAIDILNGTEPDAEDFKFGESILDIALTLTSSSVLIDRINKDKKDIKLSVRKNGLINKVEKAIQEANALSELDFSYSTMRATAGKLMIAIQGLEGLIAIAEEEGDYSQARKLRDTRDNLASQHRKMSII